MLVRYQTNEEAPALASRQPRGGTYLVVGTALYLFGMASGETFHHKGTDTYRYLIIETRPIVIEHDS